jgi:hypothetical protein
MDRTNIAQKLLPKCEEGISSLEIVQRELLGLPEEEEDAIAAILDKARGLRQEEAPFCPPRTPKADAGYADEDPGDGRPDRRYGG